MAALAAFGLDMFSFKTLRARMLSRKGEHARALAMCNMKDIQVLSRAGMHLSVLEHSSRPSIERALALAHIGEIDAAVGMARQLANQPSAKILMGLLATHATKDIRSIIQDQPGWTNLQAYCECSLGDIAKSKTKLRKLAPIHALYVALIAKQSTLASAAFNQLYAASSLAAPSVPWAGHRLDLGCLTCDLPGQGIESGPLISVILTAQNEEAYLPVAARSILQQDWRNLELLIVDDGSLDNTFEVAKALAKQDTRVRLIRMSENVGTWRAKNIALKEARGLFITMHDADDWSHPSKLSLQITPLLQDADLMCTSSYFFRIDEATGLPFTRNANSFLRWNPSSLLFRRTVISELGDYFPNLFGGDCEYASRIETRWGNQSHVRIKKPLAIGWQRINSLSNLYRERDSTRHRLAHWEQWRRFHAEAYARQNLSQLHVHPEL